MLLLDSNSQEPFPQGHHKMVHLPLLWHWTAPYWLLPSTIDLPHLDYQLSSNGSQLTHQVLWCPVSSGGGSACQSERMKFNWGDFELSLLLTRKAATRNWLSQLAISLHLSSSFAKLLAFRMSFVYCNGKSYQSLISTPVLLQVKYTLAITSALIVHFHSLYQNHPFPF